MPTSHANRSGPLKEILPIQFEGGFRFESFSDTCLKCGHEIGAEGFQGETSWWGRRCCYLTLTGHCQVCRSSLVVKMRIRGEDGGKAQIENLADASQQPLSAGNMPIAHRLMNLVKQIAGLKD